MRTISTDHLLLRPAIPEDFPVLFSAIFSDSDVMKWLLVCRSMSLVETEEFIKENFQLAKPYGLATLCKKNSDNEVIGFAGIIPCKFLSLEDLEFGFAISKRNWGKGYATEIGKELIKYGFNVLRRERLFALAHPENEGSVKVLRKLGLSFMRNISTIDRGPRGIYGIEESPFGG